MRIFIVCLYLYCRWRSGYQNGRVWIPLTGLTTQHFDACPKPGPGFPTSYIVVSFVFSELSLEVIVRFVDIGEIFNHLFINDINKVWPLTKQRRTEHQILLDLVVF